MVECVNQSFYNFTSCYTRWEMKAHPVKRLFFTVIGSF
jgi:hypothetical protein